MVLRIKFRTRPTGTLAALSDEGTRGGRIELDNTIYAGDGTWFEYLTLISKPTIEETDVATMPLVRHVSSGMGLDASNTRNVLALVEEPTPFVVMTLTRNGAVPHRIYLEEGLITVIASVQGWESLKELATVIEEKHTRFELSGTTEVDGIGYPLGRERLQSTFHGKLTGDQLRTLRVAYHLGYFEIPQEATAQDVADELDISQSAVSEKLRRIHQRLCGVLFGQRQPDVRETPVD